MIEAVQQQKCISGLFFSNTKTNKMEEKGKYHMNTTLISFLFERNILPNAFYLTLCLDYQLLFANLIQCSPVTLQGG